MRNFFKDIVSQDFAVQILRKQLKDKTTSHAYLFVGPVGCNKLNCAKAFAQTLLGEKFAEQIQNDTFVDVKIFEPAGVQSYLTSQIKEIINDSILAPIQGSHKIYIIKNSESLGTSSANAFLKTLEEPTDNVCFILLANNESNVLPTIVSRCQIINFKQVPYDEALGVVQTNSGASLDDCERALFLYGGNTTKAIDFCLDQNLQDYYSEIIDLLKQVDNFDDWDCLLRSSDIVNKANEIVDVYKSELEDKTKELSDVLEHSAISILQDQNKRSVTTKQKELLYLLCAIIKMFYRDLLKDSNQEKYIQRINCVSELEQNLSYNISLQNFCDVVMLKIKRI